jgi:hypothetical protein
MMLDQSYEGDHHRQTPSLTEGGGARPARRSRQKKVSDCLSRADEAQSPSSRCEQRTLFDLDGHDGTGLRREVEMRPSRRARKKKASDGTSRADDAQPPASRYRQLTLFDLDGDDETGLLREVERRPALGARKRASKFAPEQMVFEWSEHPPTAAGN